MADVPDDTGPIDFEDNLSESTDNVSLSDPGSDTEAGESSSEEDFVATDRATEEIYKDQEPESDADSAHAAHHDQEVEAYMERSRSQAIPSQQTLPQADFAAAVEVLDDSVIEPAASSEPDSNIDGHSTAANSNATESNAESASGHEQPAQVPAMTAETQPDAVLPSVVASQATDAQSEAEKQPEAAQAPETAEHDDSGNDGEGASGQQPADTRADYAEIQKVLGHAASQDIHDAASSESDSASGDDAIPEPALKEEEQKPDNVGTEAAGAAAVEAEPVLEQMQPVAEPTLAAAESSAAAAVSAATAVESAPTVTESAPTMTPSTQAISGSGTEKQPAVGMKRLPSLPVRRAAPSTTSRSAAPAGETAAPTVSSEQEAKPAAAAAPAGNGAASPAKPTAPAVPVASNGHADALPSNNGTGNGAATSTRAVNDGNGTSSGTQAANDSSSSSKPAATPASSSTPPKQPAGNANPSIPPRAAGSGNPSIPPRAAGTGNPSIPPRQPAAANPSSNTRPAGNGQAGPAAAAAPVDDEPAEHRELREKVQRFRVLLVQLTMRLGQSTRGSIVQQVNYRLDLAERIRIPQTSNTARRPYGFEAAMRTAEGLEAEHPDKPLPFSCTVMVMGMTGVGKSATINSVLDQGEVAPTNAFEPATKGIREVVGTVAGVRVKFIDTPGLQPSAANIGSNQRLLNQMHGAFKKHKPDIMLYMDRADIFRTDMSDVPLLRAITETFGASMWFNTIVALTHAAAAPPDGNNGPLSYDTYTRTRTQLLQQNIRQASGDMRLLNPVALVENHPACRKNERGWGILPNQLVWKPHLILLLLSSKLLSETDTLLKIQANTGGAAGGNSQAQALRMLLGGGGRKMPPIPYLIANFIQKKSPRKPPDEERQFKHDSELKDLNVMDKKEEMRRRREYSRMRSDEAKAEAGANQAGVPAPDIPLQPTFDADNNSHRYRYMEPPPDAALCRPVMDPNGFDHDDGMNAFTVEKSTVMRKKGSYVGGAPAYLMAQVHKERDMFNVVSEAEASYYHTHKLISTASLDGQTVQTDALFTGKLETRFRNHPRNKTGAAVLVSRLKEDGGLPTKGPIVYGAKLEDRFKPSDKVKVILASATLMNKTEGRGAGADKAWNHCAETRIKAGEDDKLLVTVGLNNMRYRGKSGYGGNVSTQYAATPGTTVMGNLQLNNERAGKVTMRVSSHDYPKLGFSLLVPTLAYVWGRIRGGD